MKEFKIAEKRKIWFAIFGVVIVIGLVSMFTKGFNLGIDFTGGTLLELKFNQQVTVESVRDVLKNYGLENSIIQLAENENKTTEESIVFIRTNILEDANRVKIMEDLTSTVGSFDVLRVEQVGAVIGGEITQQAFTAIAVSWLLMIVYITWRFEFKFAIAAILALLQNVLVVLSFFSLFHIEIDASFVAALLTVVGFSINDTIVIFDRIRENLRSHRRADGLEALVNKSVSQTLTRSIYTVMTVLFVTISLYIFGGDTTKNFSLALLVGFGCGFFTSVFCSGSFWIELNNLKGAKAK